MSKRQNRKKIALIPEAAVEVTGDSILLPDDSEGGNDCGAKEVTSKPSLAPWNIVMAMPASPHVIIAPPVARNVTTANTQLPILQANAASSIEVTPENSRSRQLRLKGKLPPDGARSKRTSAGGKPTSIEIVTSDDETEPSFAEWNNRNKWKKQRSIFIDESKLLHDHNKKLIDCTLCGKAISSSQLRQHMETVHEISVSYDCDVCDQTGFKSKVALRQHVLSSHRLHCCFCRKEFPSKRDLFIHRKKHNDDPYDCRQCGKSFSTNPVLRQHVFVQHPKTAFSCLDCKEFFPSLRSKLVHDRIVHRRRPLRCRVCQRSFLMKRFYVLHSSASNCRPTAKKCPHCRRAFDNRIIFQAHKTGCRFKNSYSKADAPSHARAAGPSPGGRDCSSEGFREVSDVNNPENFVERAFSGYSILELQSQTQTESNFLICRAESRDRRRRIGTPIRGKPQDGVCQPRSTIGRATLVDIELPFASSTEITVPQIDFPSLSETDAASRDLSAELNASDSLEIGEILGEIFGQSPHPATLATGVALGSPFSQSTFGPSGGNIIIAEPKRNRANHRDEVDDDPVVTCQGSNQLGAGTPISLDDAAVLRCHDYCASQSGATNATARSPAPDYTLIQYPASDFPGLYEESFVSNVRNAGRSVELSSKAAIISKITSTPGHEFISTADTEPSKLDLLSA